MPWHYSHVEPAPPGCPWCHGEPAALPDCPRCHVASGVAHRIATRAIYECQCGARFEARYEAEPYSDPGRY